VSCDPSEWRDHLTNDVSAIKLASQLLSRRADLPEDQRLLLETVMNQADGLSADLARLASIASSGPRPPFR
jgi:hypothetical protein